MVETYRDFTIQENKIKCNYKEENFTITNYLVYREINGRKYFLSGITAFDTVDEAKKIIDKILE